MLKEKEHQNMINNVQKRKEEIDSLKRQYPELKDYTGETTKTTRSERRFQEKAKRQKKEMQRRKELGRSVEPKNITFRKKKHRWPTRLKTI